MLRPLENAFGFKKIGTCLLLNYWINRFLAVLNQPQDQSIHLVG